MSGKKPDWMSEEDSVMVLELQETSYIHIKEQAFDVIRACIAAFSVIIIGISFVQSELGFPGSASQEEFDQAVAESGFELLTVVSLYASTIFSSLFFLFAMILIMAYAINLLSGLSTRGMLDLTVPRDDINVTSNSGIDNGKTILHSRRYEYWLRERGKELKKASEELVAGQKLILWSFLAGGILVMLYLSASNLAIVSMLIYHLGLSAFGFLFLIVELFSKIFDKKGFTKMIGELPDAFIPSTTYRYLIYTMIVIASTPVIYVFGYVIYTEFILDLIS